MERNTYETAWFDLAYLLSLPRRLFRALVYKRSHLELNASRRNPSYFFRYYFSPLYGYFVLFRRPCDDHFGQFEFTLRDRKYACKLISSLNPFTLYRFYPNGTVGHVHRLTTRMLSRGRWGDLPLPF